VRRQWVVSAPSSDRQIRRTVFDTITYRDARRTTAVGFAYSACPVLAFQVAHAISQHFTKVLLCTAVIFFGFIDRDLLALDDSGATAAPTR
jgi:hypothetical protein